MQNRLKGNYYNNLVKKSFGDLILGEEVLVKWKYKILDYLKSFVEV